MKNFLDCFKTKSDSNMDIHICGASDLNYLILKDTIQYYAENNDITLHHYDYFYKNGIDSIFNYQFFHKKYHNPIIVFICVAISRPRIKEFLQKLVEQIKLKDNNIDQIFIINDSLSSNFYQQNPNGKICMVSLQKFYQELINSESNNNLKRVIETTYNLLFKKFGSEENENIVRQLVSILYKDDRALENMPGDVFLDELPKLVELSDEMPDYPDALINDIKKLILKFKQSSSVVPNYVKIEYNVDRSIRFSKNAGAIERIILSYFKKEYNFLGPVFTIIQFKNYISIRTNIEANWLQDFANHYHGGGTDLNVGMPLSILLEKDLQSSLIKKSLLVNVKNGEILNSASGITISL